MTNQFIFKTFEAKTIDELNKTVNFYFTKHNVSLDKLAVRKIAFNKDKNGFNVILPIFELDSKVGRPIRMNFIETDTHNAFSDKLNFYVRKNELNHSHIVTYDITKNDSGYMGYVFFVVPEKQTSR